MWKLKQNLVVICEEMAIYVSSDQNYDGTGSVRKRAKYLPIIHLFIIFSLHVACLFV